MRISTIIVSISLLVIAGSFFLHRQFFDGNENGLPKQYLLPAKLTVVERYIREIVAGKPKMLNVTNEDGDYKLSLKMPADMIRYKFRFYEKEGNAVALILLTIEDNESIQSISEFEKYIVDEIHNRIKLGNLY